MLEVKYYKDYRHNYLILKDNGSLSENVYQRKMVTENKIKGLLSSQERNINGEILLYYEITSKQSFFSIFERKSISMEELRKFFLQLKMVNDMLQKYLLDGSGLILRPEYIFQNIETGEYFFIYYPDPEENGFSQFLDFLISRVDNEDTGAVEAVYKIADLVGRDQFVLDEILKWFQDDIEVREKENETPSQCRETEYRDDVWQRDDEDKEETEEKKGSKDEWKKAVPFWGAGITGAAFLIYIMYNFQLSYQEQICLFMGWGIITVLVLGPVAWIFSIKYLKIKQQDKETLEQEKEFQYVPVYENDSIAAAADLGNTVFIPWTESCENKLYSLDRKNKCHIDLERLPITVGKLAGAVDMVIEEKSISRMHAKFTRSGNSICITDLNSTNGTFRNGMRLLPNASEVIEPGDEIRLGKLKFIYR